MGNKTVIITGGTGLVGTALSKHLAAGGYKVIVLSRNRDTVNQKENKENISFAHWDIKSQTIDADAVAKADAIIHLAGAGVVDKPWTESYKMEIINSRIRSSSLLVKALREMPNQVQTVISTSAIGYYGPDKSGVPFTETAKPVRSFLGETCRLWEESIQPVKALGKRLVINRVGIVLSSKGGALAEFEKPLAFRVGAVLGSGQQIVSWIHIDDLCRLYQYELENTLEGVYNAVAPHPVSNRELTTSLGKAKYGNGFITMPVPAFVLKIMMGDRSIEVLKSATVSSEKIQHTGFNFMHPEIKDAMKILV
jgi:uncharacterized protein (TIGR01777 family)